MDEELCYKELFEELTYYERNGVRISVNGLPASPMQVVSSHLIEEESTYMRDYVLDEKGKVAEIGFQYVKK